MSVIRPRYFGFEGQFYWDLNNQLFPVDPVTEQVTDGQVSTWLTGANKTEEVASVDYTLDPQRYDVTTRPTALRGFAKETHTVNTVSLLFTVFHNRTTTGFVETLITSSTSISEMPLAVMDEESQSRQGLIGNFNIAIAKAEPIRGIQTWSVTATPNSYVDYWIEP